MELIDADWRPVVDKRPPRPVSWRDVWRGSPWLITVFGSLCVVLVIALIWGLAVGW